MDAELLGYTFALLAGLFFGLSDALVRAAAVKLKPMQNLLISLLVGSPFLWIVAVSRGPPVMTMKALLLYIIAGLLNFVVGRLLFYYSITYTGATTASIVTSPTVIVSALLAWILLGEELSPLQLLGIILVVLAVYLVSQTPSGEALHGGKTSIGILAGLASTVVFAMTAILVRSASGYMHADPIYGVAISYTSAIPIVVLLNKGIPDPRLLPRKHFYYMTLAAVVVAFAQLSRYYALHLVTVAGAAVIISLFPFFTLLFTLALSRELKEKPQAIHLLASILAVVGIILVNYIG